jgi:hypothetical protein
MARYLGAQIPAPTHITVLVTSETKPRRPRLFGIRQAVPRRSAVDIMIGIELEKSNFRIKRVAIAA